MTRNLNVGDPAPDFTRPSSAGETIRLSQFRGKSAVVLYFYPRDNTSVCTAQACLFRDHYETVRAAGAEVIGVSANTLESHQKFADRHHLPFPLISDADGSLRALYGVSATMWVIPRRVTFLIDRDGIIQHVCSSLFQAAPHVDETLRVLAILQHAES